MSNEYEREPVPDKALLGFRSFVGQYAGEHTAGTELMIGPLFVAAGVSAVDLLGGLLRRKPSRGSQLDVPDGAHRDTGAAHALLPARTDLRPPSRDHLQRRERPDVLPSGRLDDHRLGNGPRRVVRFRDAAAERPLSNRRGLGRRGARNRRRGHHRRRLWVRVRGARRQHRRALDDAGVRRVWPGRAPAARRHVARGVLAQGEQRDLDRRRSAARPDQVHLLAR